MRKKKEIRQNISRAYKLKKNTKKVNRNLNKIPKNQTIKRQIQRQFHCNINFQMLDKKKISN